MYLIYSGLKYYPVFFPFDYFIDFLYMNEKTYLLTFQLNF